MPKFTSDERITVMALISKEIVAVETRLDPALPDTEKNYILGRLTTLRAAYGKIVDAGVKG